MTKNERKALLNPLLDPGHPQPQQEMYALLSEKFSTQGHQAQLREKVKVHNKSMDTKKRLLQSIEGPASILTLFSSKDTSIQEYIAPGRKQLNSVQ